MQAQLEFKENVINSACKTLVKLAEKMACGYFNSSGDQLYWTQECVQIQERLIGQVRNNAYVFGVAALSYLKCLYQLQQFGLSVF